MFERPADNSGSARLLVSQVGLCNERECACRDVTLRSIGLELGKGSSSAELSVDGLRALFDSGRPMESRLQLDVGILEPDDYKGRIPLSEDWVEFLNSQLDGELLDVLHERWLRAKAWRSREPQEIHWPHDLDRMVGWFETHSDHRKDLFVREGDDRVLMAEELFCLKPSCSCDEATVDFMDCVDPKTNRWKSIGGVRVQIAGARVVRYEPERGEKKAIRVLWEAFSHRHRVEERLSKHRQVLRAAAQSRQGASDTPQKTRERAGRNDPCPCGSGQKYKRCCLGADQSSA